MKKEYILNFTDNNNSNDYLRCLWYRFRENFGKSAWNIIPRKDGVKKIIHIGYVDLGVQTINSTPTSISCTYSKRGCLKSLIFENSKLTKPKVFERIFEKCIEEAKEFDKHKRNITIEITLDENMTFQLTEGMNFKLIGNKLYYKCRFYDESDLKTYSQNITKIIIALLSFDSLKFVSLASSGVEKLRTQNKFTVKVNFVGQEDEGNEMHSNDKFKGFKISKYFVNYIDELLERKLDYENPYNNFEKSVLSFTQALFFEEMANTRFALDFTPQEYATVSYMSALEIITLDDIKPLKCDECGQERYSIAKRVISLVENATDKNAYFTKMIKQFYSARSKFIHTGEYMSTSNYIGTSSPLLSSSKSSGIINQTFHLETYFKEIIKNCILWHEKK